MTLWDLLIPLAVAVVAAVLGWFGYHQPPGKHHRDEEGSALAWLYRLRRDSDVTPATAARIHLAVTGALVGSLQPVLPPLVPAWEPVPAATGPRPAAMADADDDPDHPYLNRPDWEYATGQWPAHIFKGEQDASPAT